MPRCQGVLLILMLTGCSQQSAREQRPDSTASADSRETTILLDEDEPVPNNRGPDVEDGFRGEVHPLLESDQSLEVKADCSPIGRGRGYDEGYFPQQFRGPFDEFSVARAAEEYTARDFSPFLPQEIGQPGQIWEIDVDRIVPLLMQFHSGASMRLEAPGRLPGPNGGFAVLRAISDSHLDVLARIHVQFVLAPGTYLTPAYFEGRLLIDRTQNRVEAFSLALPTDIRLNMTLTAVLPTEALIDIVHVDRMELIGGASEAGEGLVWTDEVPLAEARAKLKGSFYRFLDIQWVPPELAVEQAREQNRPILAIVMWGDLDDQSC